MKRFVALVLAIVMMFGVGHVDVEAKTVTAKDLKGKSRQEVVDLVGEMFTADYQRSDVLASVMMAQFLLETGFGQSELFQNANNGFGLRCDVIDKSWKGSTWDGKSKYTKLDWYIDKNGRERQHKVSFRKYSSFADSIADHSAYIAGTKNGKKLRYDVKGVSDYKTVCKRIANGGYAWKPDEYCGSLVNIIKKYNLTKYDKKKSSSDKKTTETKKTETEKKQSSTKYYPGSWVVDANDGFLNCREKPSAKSKIMCKYYNDTMLIIDEVSGSWGRVHGVDGWVNLSYCYDYSKVKSTKKFRVEKEFLNVRSSYSASSKVVGRLEVGTTFTVTEMKGKWGRVQYKSGNFGWVNTGYAREIK